MVTARSSAVFVLSVVSPAQWICFSRSRDRESAHHKMIIDAGRERGMAVWIISSGIDAICEKTDNEELLCRLRYIKE